MVDRVVECSTHASGCVSVQSPALLLPLLDCFAHIIMVPNQDASPLLHFVHLFRIDCERKGYLAIVLNAGKNA
jgi:hypothetical protein